MQELQKQITSVQSSVSDAVGTLKIAELEEQLRNLQTKAAMPDFWSDPREAQEVMKQQSRLQSRVTPWRELQQSLNELSELAQLGDESLQGDLEKQYQQIETRFQQLKQQLKFSGSYDDYDVILSIHSGAGGTDAQDWAAMLHRMYVRWAEKQDMQVTTVDQSAGDEAGLKRVTLEISGDFAYGKLKGEHGVHRLVRLSPFNADNLRQTSFAKVDVLPKIDRPEALELNEKDLKIDVYRAGGHGGQSVNTTDSAVRVTHLPTGITVAIQNERSQLQNKETALTILRSRLIQLQMEQHQDNLQELKGPNQSAEWGNQIRSYVLHPYKQVKDLRTRYESSDPEGTLDGELDPFIDAYLEHTLSHE
jgi:peptide chain release factor 2